MKMETFTHTHTYREREREREIYIYIYIEREFTRFDHEDTPASFHSAARDGRPPDPRTGKRPEVVYTLTANQHRYWYFCYQRKDTTVGFKQIRVKDLACTASRL